MTLCREPTRALTLGILEKVHLKCNDRWEIVVAVSDGQFQQVCACDMRVSALCMGEMSFYYGASLCAGTEVVSHVCDVISATTQFCLRYSMRLISPKAGLTSRIQRGLQCT